MLLLIDGYNLLAATAITGRGSGPGGFARSRLALLDCLADALDPALAAQTVVVFDAQGAPPGLPKAFTHRGILVRFAPRHQSADALIEELIGAATAPRRLTVVSSDHRIQRAACRRRATAVDSDVWYARLQRDRAAPATPTRLKPQPPLLESEVLGWLEAFGGQRLAEDIQRAETPGPAPETAPGAPSPTPKPADEKDIDLPNPFPPGYGEDLLEGPDR
jgi:predicted RNA-binding protein with PIN domain